jgi:hypothetical protein
MKHRFEAPLTARGPKGAWTFLAIPFDAVKSFGAKGRIPVKGTMNGFAFRNSLMPDGDGTHSMTVSRELQERAKARAGDVVKMTLERDDAERVVEVPPELKKALAREKKAGAAFTALAFSHRKAYAEWIGGAKRPETKAARVAKAVEMLRAGKKLLR